MVPTWSGGFGLQSAYKSNEAIKAHGDLKVSAITFNSPSTSVPKAVIERGAIPTTDEIYLWGIQVMTDKTGVSRTHLQVSGDSPDNEVVLGSMLSLYSPHVTVFPVPIKLGKGNGLDINFDVLAGSAKIGINLYYTRHSET